MSISRDSDDTLERFQKSVRASLARSNSPLKPHTHRGRWLAVEISDVSVKSLCLFGGKLRNPGSFHVPAEARDDRELCAELIGKHLRHTLRSNRVQKYFVVLPTKHVRSMVVQLPRLSDDDLASALSLKALKMAGSAPHEWEVNCIHLDRKLGTYLVTLHNREQLRWLSDVFHRAGHLPHAVSSTPATFQRIMPEEASVDDDALDNEPVDSPVWVVVEMHRITTGIHIYHNGVLAYSRMAKVGGEDLTKALMVTVATPEGFVELDHAAAQHLKEVVGFPGPEQTEEIPGSLLLPEQIRQMLEPKLNSLMFEIRNSIRFYQQQSGTRHLSRLLITGGSARMKGLDEYLHAHLKIRPQHFSSSDLSYSTDKMSEVEKDYVFSDEATLASILLEKPIQQNLLPSAFTVERRLRPVFRVATVAFIAVLAVTVTLGTFFRHFLAVGSADISSAQANVNLEATLEMLQASVARIDSECRGLHEIEGYRSTLGHSLADIAQRIPPGMLLENVRLTRDTAEDRLTITGTLKDSAGRSQPITTLVNQPFEASPFVRSVRLLSGSPSGESYQFTLECVLYYLPRGRDS